MNGGEQSLNQTQGSSTAQGNLINLLGDEGIMKVTQQKQLTSSIAKKTTAPVG